MSRRFKPKVVWSAKSATILVGDLVMTPGGSILGTVDDWTFVKPRAKRNRKPAKART